MVLRVARFEFCFGYLSGLVSKGLVIYACFSYFANIVASSFYMPCFMKPRTVDVSLWSELQHFGGMMGGDIPGFLFQGLLFSTPSDIIIIVFPLLISRRCPEVRVEAYKLCLSLAGAAPNLAAPSSPVPLEALVALCVRGLDDESPAARLAAAAATGASLAAGIEGSAAENERLGVIAARDQVHETIGGEKLQELVVTQRDIVLGINPRVEHVI